MTTKEGSPIRTNYHTHTDRCKHAWGTDESYVTAAIKGGFRYLGFSDHMPWPYPGGFVSGSRMDLAQFDDYLQSVRALQAAYAGQIEIGLGLEVEHYPEYLGWMLEQKEAQGIQFLIFGNHYDTWQEEVYYGKIQSPGHVAGYAGLTLRGIASGLYDCLAHPDLFLRAYPRFDAACRSASRDISQAAKAMDLPLEYNLSGFNSVHRRQAGAVGYPCLDFWQIAAQEGCSAIIGLDAHQPEQMLNTPLYDLARQHLKALGMPEVTSLGKAPCAAAAQSF